jgi:hypothetical protein
MRKLRLSVEDNESRISDHALCTFRVRSIGTFAMGAREFFGIKCGTGYASQRENASIQSLT